jgi:Flp pilus assembly protein TadD
MKAILLITMLGIIISNGLCQEISSKDSSGSLNGPYYIEVLSGDPNRSPVQNARIFIDGNELKGRTPMTDNGVLTIDGITPGQHNIWAQWCCFQAGVPDVGIILDPVGNCVESDRKHIAEFNPGQKITLKLFGIPFCHRLNGYYKFNEYTEDSLPGCKPKEKYAVCPSPDDCVDCASSCHAPGSYNFDTVICSKGKWTVKEKIDIDACNSLATQGKYTEANQCYDYLIASSPEDENLLYKKGVALLFLGRSAEAKDLFEKVIKVNPNSVKAWHAKGAAANDLGNPNELLSAEERAIKIDPNCAICWLGKGVAFDALGKHDNAVQARKQAVQMDRKSVIDTLLSNGLGYINTGNYVKALDSLNQLLDIEPNSDKGWANKGVALSGLGRNAEANQAFDRALGINPNMAVAWYDKGIIQQRMNLMTESNAAIARAKELGYSGPS